MIEDLGLRGMWGERIHSWESQLDQQVERGYSLGTSDEAYRDLIAGALEKLDMDLATWQRMLGKWKSQ